jgi:hypothetical protein
LKYLIGFPVQPPDFMVRNKTGGEKDKPLNPSLGSSDGSNSEWTPASEKVHKNRGEHY